MHLIFDHAEYANIPLRFAATKLIEGDERVTKALNFCPNELEMLEHIIVQMENECGLDRAAAIADMRFKFIEKICKQTVVKPLESKESIRSRKIDKLLTGKYTAIPFFIIIMSLIFILTFNVIGLSLQELLETGIGKLSDLTQAALLRWNISDIITSLIINGIFSGVGSVISFVPIIITLFFFLSLLEDSGYMARVAFVMDKLLRKIGLSGRSIVPMLIGFGCTVPGVMACRTLPSERDRKMTIMLTPFMSCSAKLPIYAFFANAFFPKNSGFVMIALYFLGMITAVIVALISKKFTFKGEAVPFVMELPNYRLPSLKNVMRLLWDKAKDFIQRAFTVIFIATVVIWYLQSFDFKFNLVTDSQNSILACLAGFISPIFKPLGFGSWEMSTALITGFIAKESVVATLNVLIGPQTAITSIMSLPSACAFLVFCLLYTPCVAAVASIKRELGRKWAISIVLGQCAIAWLLALLTKIIVSIF